MVTHESIPAQQTPGYQTGLTYGDGYKRGVADTLAKASPQDMPSDAFINAFLKAEGSWIEACEAPRESGVAVDMDISEADAAAFNAEAQKAFRDAWRAAAKATHGAAPAAGMPASVLSEEAITALHACRKFLVGMTKPAAAGVHSISSYSPCQELIDKIDAALAFRSPAGKELPVWQELQLGMLLGKLSDWRNADHEDSIAIGRSDIIAIIEGFKALGKFA